MHTQFDDVRPGSLLALARRVADRCERLCNEQGVTMSDDIYDQAVHELAPHFAEAG
jgi:enamine deaminase RidA (YjgF/YER057c/UK114 family)